MKKIIRSLLIIVAFIFVFGYTNVFAFETHGEGEKCLKLEFDDGGFDASVTVNQFLWTSKDDEFHTNNGNYTIVILSGMNGDKYPELSTPDGFANPDNITVDSRPNVGHDPLVTGDEYIYTITLTDYNTTNGCEFLGGISLHEGAEPTLPTHDVDTTVTITISGEELEYHYVADKPNEADVTFFKFDINGGTEENRLVPFTFGNADYTYIDGVEPPRNVSSVTTKNPINYRYPYNDSGFVEFCVNGGSSDEYTKIEINGVDYANQAPHTQKEYFERFGGGASLQFCIKDVPYSTSYDVVVEGRGISDDKRVAGFDWSYLSHDRSPDVSEENEGDFAHGKVEFVHAKYVDDENQVYEFSSASAYNAGRYHGTGEIFQWANGDKNYQEEDRRMAWGNVLAPYGTELTIRIVPDEGYQLVGLTTSEHGFQATDESGVYKISLTRENLTFNDGGFRLEPVFAKIGSEVQATSTKVKGGTIATNQNVSNGSLKLEVSDVNVGDSTREGFEAKATSEGFTVNNIVDISLYNAIYKGGKKDNNGNYLSWDTEINNLANKATVALELEDNMQGKDVALVHEEHDGDKLVYTLVPVNYNSENNSIEFETDSFSNYAIIVKSNGNEEEPSNPDQKEIVTVEFNSTGGTEIAAIKINKGEKVDKPEDPVNGKRKFAGWFLDEAYHDEFDFNSNVEQDITLFAKWSDDEDESNKTEKYNVTDDNGNSISFKEEDGHEFNLSIVDYLGYTKEEVMALAGITSEMYDEVFDGLKEMTKNQGTLISYFEIDVIDEDGNKIHEGPFTIKIKMTPEMKKYNTFKLVCVDDMKVGDIITMKVEGDYLVGTINHLSTYTLNASTINNPQTNDNVLTYVLMLTLSLIGLIGSGLYIRKVNA